MATTLSFEIEIDAPVDAVWRVLTDFERYPEWNPFTPRIECSRVVGQPVTIDAYLGNQTKATVTHLHLNKFEPEKQLCWGADRWVLRVNRCQVLTAVSATTTHYKNTELFAGPLAPLVMWLHKKNLMAGYEKAARGLKKQAEAWVNGR